MISSQLYLTKIFCFSIILAFSILIAGCATEKPDVAKGDVVVWTNEALAATLNYSYASYPQQFQMAARYFTTEAWKGYLEALRISKTLEMVDRQQLVASAVVQGTPIIFSENIVNDHYVWQVRVPMLLIYENPRKRNIRPALVTVSVLRVSDQRIGVRGLAINQLLIQTAPPKEERVIRRTP